jgi:hypothetical protein
MQMKRGDLDRPTGPHLHLASAPSVFAYIRDTPVSRFDQNAAGQTWSQADTQINRRG